MPRLANLLGVFSARRLEPHPSETQRFLPEKTRPLDPQLRERLYQRLAPVLTTAITAAISIWIAALDLTDYRDTGQINYYITHYRTAVQAVVHIISTLLGLLWIYSVCAMINRYTRLHYVKEAVSFDTLRLWCALSIRRIDLNLPLYYATISLLFVVASSLPTTIWVGALTPERSHFKQDISLAVPKTGPDSYPFLLNGFDCGGPPLYQDNGTFTLCPANHFSGNMLASARSATPIAGSRNHTKFDASSYNYVGRSYGVGSAPGLTDTTWTNNPLAINYTYLEDGYRTRATCLYNTSSDWRIDVAQDNSKIRIPGAPQPKLPNIYYAHGHLPNSNWSRPEDPWDANWAVGESPGDRIISIGSHNDPDLPTYYVAIAARKAYKRLHQVQCQIIFTPTTFRVTVNIQDASVQIRSTGLAQDPEPRGLLRSRVSGAMDHISEIATTAITSIFGDALMDNIHNMQARQNLPHGDADLSDETILRAVEDSFNAIMDDFLVSMASTALTMPDATTYITAEACGNAIKVGSRFFVLATLIINVLTLLCVIFATFRESIWSNLPMFDYTDQASMSWGSAFGSTRSENFSRLADGTLRQWNGDPQNDVLRSVTTRLQLGPPTNQIYVTM
ncbi:MAG: hypothetical protein M1837_006804 [Sclerophora amabilis]|nr:MAG: hypothetical protein M1837_006804 [Sclerophora amabilis]